MVTRRICRHASLVALVAAAGCAKADGPAKPATTTTAPATAHAGAIQPPAVSEANGGPAQLVAFVPGGFVVLPKMLDDFEPPVDESGHPPPAPPIPYPAGKPQRASELALDPDRERPIALLVDRGVTLRELAPLRDALAARCWGFVVTTGSRYNLLLPAPCPVQVSPDEAVLLGIDIDASGHATVALDKVHESKTVARAELEAALREQKQSAFFADRTDVSIALPDTATVTDLISVITTARRAGFTTPSWVAHDRVPR